MREALDFSFAVLVAAAIGIFVGGTAFSLVWLIHVLGAWGGRRGLVAAADPWIAWGSGGPPPPQPATRRPPGHRSGQPL